MSEETVRVAVRVRPFNAREKEREAKLCINMRGNTTTIFDVNDPDKTKRDFTFDFSYWSHDSFHIDANGVAVPDSDRYADQTRVFNDLGQGVLKNAFGGFNTSLFAYGQTGSGKFGSYSMVGYGNNKGILPVTCDELFKEISRNKGSNQARYQVTFSMLEIYNEQVRDLLSKETVKGGLQVRQNPALGRFFVQGLIKVPVASYDEINRKIEEGTANRTVAATNMNATSSRAHTVVTIMFEQIRKDETGKERTLSSEINLVDLAGSERANSTGATGDRLKEGSAINQSLTCLGNVISALAEQSAGKKTLVPYRDSTLTKLLQNALGGNSKTVMIAALSPADINYDETLSTLRYADRAKQIKNKAVVNESETDKLIRMLKEENDKLRKALEGGVVVEKKGLSQEEIDELRKKMEEEIRAQLESNMEVVNRDQNWEVQHAAMVKEQSAEDKAADEKRKKIASVPHFVNLNEDSMLSGVVFHFLEKPSTTFGKGKQGQDTDVSLAGLSISKDHAIATLKPDGSVTLKQGNSIAKTKVNGKPLTGEIALSHKDRILFGSNHLYVFVNPKIPKSSSATPADITWEFAQGEIAQAKGYDVGTEGLTRDQQRAQEQVLELLPLLGEANALSEEMNKQRSFEIVLFSGITMGAPGDNAPQTKVLVRMKNLQNGNEWLWDRAKFMDRRFMMQALYQEYLDEDPKAKKMVGPPTSTDDPFFDPLENILIGTASVFLQSLAYGLDLEDNNLMITDYKGEEQGTLSVAIIPCNKTGGPLGDDFYVEEPSELLAQPYAFKVVLRSAEISKLRYVKGIKLVYTAFRQPHPTETPMVSGASPKFNHASLFAFDKVTPELIEWFENGCLNIMVYAAQEDSKADAKYAGLTTKELRVFEERAEEDQRKLSFVSNGPRLSRVQSASAIGSTAEKIIARYQKKEAALRHILEKFDKKPAAEQTYHALHDEISGVVNAKRKFKGVARILGKLSQTRLANLPPVGSGTSLQPPPSPTRSQRSANGASKACSIQ